MTETPGACLELTERRKADRAKMAAQVAGLARQHGLRAAVAGEVPGTRETSVELAGPHGLRLRVRFSGGSPESQPDTYLLSWYGMEDGWRLRPFVFGARVNPFHGHKATDVARGFPELTRLLTRRFAAIADGSAFIRDVTDAFLIGRVAEYRRSGFERSLLEYLGMTAEEYGDWFTTGVVPARVQRTWQRQAAR